MDAIVSIVLGAVILTVVTIAYGGTFLLQTAGDGTQTPLQRSFFRAGHAHAGVLVILGLVCVLIQRSSGVEPGWQFASFGVLTAAILVPLGFFLSVIGRDVTKPNRWILTVWIGAGLLAVSLLAVGISVIVAGAGQLG